MSRSERVAQLRHKLVVSCQAEEGFPLNTPEHLAAIAATAVIGGASGIRASEPDNIRAIRQVVEVPIIGIYKKIYPDSEVYITPTMAEVEAIVEAGSDIIALDATDRPRPGDLTLAALIHAIRDRFDIPLMADISTLEEGVIAAQMGVDIVATTMAGYTPYSRKLTGPDIELIQALQAKIDRPIIAEGRINSPEAVRQALDAGAHAVVVGSAITRPHLLTERFAAATQPPTRDPVIAIDIGGTKIAGAVIAGESEIVLEDRIATPHQDGQQVVEGVIRLIEQMSSRYQGQPIAGIGVSTGGQVGREGRILSATDTIAGWAGTDLRGMLANHFDLPVAVLNDGQAAALAEAHFGAGRGYQSVLGLTIGTGLGGGLVIDGELQPGAQGLAGSIGHINIVPDGWRCSCGRRGCVEAYVSGSGLVKTYHEWAELGQSADTGEAVGQLALNGNETAQGAVKTMGGWLGLGLANGLAVLDADIVVIGGSVAQIGPLLFDSIRASLRRYGFASTGDTPVVPAAFGPQAGLIGAATFASISRRKVF